MNFCATLDMLLESLWVNFFTMKKSSSPLMTAHAGNVFFFQTMIHLKHIERVPPNGTMNNFYPCGYYSMLPHHAVFKDSTTTKCGSTRLPKRQMGVVSMTVFSFTGIQVRNSNRICFNFLFVSDFSILL